MDESSVMRARDVARKAGVSASAVSRAFTPGASIAPETRRRIIEAAEEIGYKPDLIARSLTSGRSNIVGIGVGNLENPFFADSLNQLSAAFATAGLRVLLFPATARGASEAQVHEVLQYRLDALVLLSTNLSSSLANQCRNAQIPVIMYNRTTADPGRVSSVTGNNRGGARAIAAHLVAAGHQRPCFMAGHDDASTSAAREEGFTGFFRDRGLPAPMRETGHFTREGAAAATRRLLTLPQPPDAIFCANDHMAIAAIDVARAEFGLDVGRDISIAGFDDVPMASWPSFSLTTYAQPTAEMVHETLAIARALGEGVTEPVHKVIEGRLVLRGSTRRLPGAATAGAAPVR
ncbi:MAG: LacI family DNA-binding transcriptional regulator [Novosphingobium sp.]